MSTQTIKKTSAKLDVKNTVASNLTQKDMRKVKIFASSCCGCGCSDVEVYRTVPFNSPLQNGDHGGDIQKDDKMVD